MKDEILGYLILGGFGVCGLLIGYFSSGYHEYKKILKRIRKFIKSN